MDKMSNKFGLPQALLDAVKQIQIQENEYQVKVKALMAKMGIKSIGELSPEEKKKFFSTLDTMHKAKDEQSAMRNPMGVVKKILQSSNDVKEKPEVKESKALQAIRAAAEKRKQNESLDEEVAGWIAMYNGQKLEIKKTEAKDLYSAKLKAIAHFKVPKSKQGLLAIKPAHNEEAELDEAKSGTGYELYHKDFSSAMAHAYDFAKKKYSIEVDPKEIDRNVAMGPKRPSSGKANAYRLLDKTGKRAIQVQVTNLDNKRYELNVYKEERDPPFTPDKPKKNPGVVPGKSGVGASIAKHLAKMAMKRQMDKKKPVKEDESLKESGGPVVWKKGNDHIEKYGDEKFALYKDGKKTEYYKSVDDAKAALEELVNPQKSMKRAGLSVARAQEVMRHRKEIGSIRKKRDALREKEETTTDKDQLTTKQKTVKKGEVLSGKKEPITINPEIQDNK
jgi:hypothetical protein